MYLPLWFNARGEFQRIGGLYHAADRTRPPECQEMLFRATSVRLAQDLIAKWKRETEDKFRRHRPQLRLERPRVDYWSDEVVALIAQLSFAIAQLRIMQNLLVGIIGKVQGLKSLPSSLSDLMKAGPVSYGFTADTAAVLRDYWERGGEELKDYRDLDSHFFAIGRHSTMEISPAGEELKVYLPDDPTVRGRRKSRHTGKVDGIAYLRDAYVRIERATDQSLDVLGVPPAKLPLMSELNPDLVETDFDTEATVAICIPGLTGGKALQTRWNPKDRSLSLEMIDLPDNDPEDCPVPLFKILDFLRAKLSDGSALAAADLKYLGSPEFMFSAMQVEMGGPWAGWLWRFELGDRLYFVLVMRDERCPWIFYRRVPPGRVPDDIVAELCRDAFLGRDRAAWKPAKVSPVDDDASST